MINGLTSVIIKSFFFFHFTLNDFRTYVTQYILVYPHVLCVCVLYVQIMCSTYFFRNPCRLHWRLNNCPYFPFTTVHQTVDIFVIYQSYILWHWTTLQMPRFVRHRARKNDVSNARPARTINTRWYYYYYYYCIPHKTFYRDFNNIYIYINVRIFTLRLRLILSIGTIVLSIVRNVMAVDNFFFFLNTIKTPTGVV